MKKFLFFILFLILSIYILSEFVGDKLIKGILEDNISSSLDRKTQIESLKINYLKGEAIINKISLDNKDFPNQLLIIDEAYIKLKSSSIFSNLVEINSVELSGIDFNYYFNFKKSKLMTMLNRLINLWIIMKAHPQIQNSLT